MEIRNYASQAIHDLEIISKNFDRKGKNGDSATVKRLISAIKKAVHFSLPDDGKLFDDGLRGLIGGMAILPYPIITIEYFIPNPTFTQGGTVAANKRLLICVDAENTLLTRNPLIVHKNDFFVYSVNHHNGLWCPQFAGAFVKHDRCLGKQKGTFYATPIPLLTEFIVDTKPTMQDAITDITPDVRTALEFLEALSCRNVSSVPANNINDQINAKRERKGKQPLFETRVLIVDVPGKSVSSNGQNGHHSSPRQHLRRGHVRRLDSGNIWVNSCVVGRSDNGHISKSYRINRSV